MLVDANTTTEMGGPTVRARPTIYRTRGQTDDELTRLTHMHMDTDLD